MMIIYLHGFNGDVDSAIYKVLSKYGDDVIYEKINYIGNRNFTDVYSRYLKEGTLVIGNSLGAYIGFQVSNYGNVPALLFNPTFNFKSGGELRHMENHRQNFQKKIILSMNDEVLDQKKNIKYLKELGYDNQINMVSMGHLIPIDFFESCFDSFHKEYKIVIDEKKQKPKKPEKKSNYYNKTVSEDWYLPITPPTYGEINTGNNVIVTSTPGGGWNVEAIWGDTNP